MSNVENLKHSTHTQWVSFLSYELKFSRNFSFLVSFFSFFLSIPFLFSEARPRVSFLESWKTYNRPLLNIEDTYTSCPGLLIRQVKGLVDSCIYTPSTNTVLRSQKTVYRLLVCFFLRSV